MIFCNMVPWVMAPQTMALPSRKPLMPARQPAAVLVPGGHIYKCGSILLHSHVELHLEHGSRLKASENKEDFLEVEAAYRDHYRDTSLKVPSYENCEYDGEPKNYFIMAKDAEDVCISGSGVIDGSEENFYGEIDHNFIEGTYYPRIPMLLMKGVQHLTIREVTLTRSAFWTVHMVGCQDVLIDGIRILNNLKMVNCDGIDPDHCRNVRINNCHIESADDCIVFKTTEKNAYLGPCENIVVSNCTLTSTSAAIKFGTESVSDFRNITVTNCVISRTNRGISLMLRDGGNIENVTFANLHINTRMFSDQWWGEAEAICVTAVDRKQGNRAGHIRNVHFENINCSGENGIFLHGSEGNSLEDISFRHIRVDIRKQTAWPIDHWDLRPSEVPGMIPGKVNGFTCVHGKSIRCEDVVIRKDSSMDPWFDQDFCWQDTENVTVVK